MDVMRGLEGIEDCTSPTVLTIGNFDGIHLGHQRMLQRLRRRAEASAVPAVLLTFCPHPVEVLRPDLPHCLIQTLEQKLETLEALGFVDRVVVIPFTQEFSRMPAEQFIEEVLWRRFHPRRIIVGFNFSFGRDGVGNPEMLERFGEKWGFCVEVVAPVEVEGRVVSSSEIRKDLRQGRVVAARTLLGRPYGVRGRVVRGDGRGRTLGFPTANVEIEGDCCLKKGVYAVLVKRCGKSLPGVANIGVRPTFSQEENASPLLEVHLFDFHDTIYGERIEVAFIDRIRDEIRFGGVEALKRQLTEDIREARRRLEEA